MKNKNDTDIELYRFGLWKRSVYIILYYFIIIKERDCHSKLIVKKLII